MIQIVYSSIAFLSKIFLTNNFESENSMFSGTIFINLFYNFILINIEYDIANVPFFDHLTKKSQRYTLFDTLFPLNFITL